MNNDTYNIPFIKQKDFEKHVAKTISSYNQALQAINLAKFAKNIVDPIKITFDKALFKKTIEEIVEIEIHRQRDKTNSNSIGYFHQNMFHYIENCEVPKKGFDVIYTASDGTKIYVEIKNKHNTMNSSSAKNTYIHMQNQLLKNPNDMCFLVEAIAKHSQNIPWKCSIDGKTVSYDRIRRVSIDQFYSMVTGIDIAFFLICKQLPITIEKLIQNNTVETVEQDTVVDELKAKNPNILKALYLLAFETYSGFTLNE